MFAYGPADATATPKHNYLLCHLIQTGLLFLYRLTQVVLEKTQLNGCSSIVECMYKHVGTCGDCAISSGKLSLCLSVSISEYKLAPNCFLVS